MGGVIGQIPPVGGYGYFLEPHIHYHLLPYTRTKEIPNCTKGKIGGGGGGGGGGRKGGRMKKPQKNCCKSKEGQINY